MKIAIKGDRFRGKEVIQILESLGGKNVVPLRGTDDLYYYINESSGIYCHDPYYINKCKKYTLEEFEKEFPFKIGDKVTIIGLSDFPKVITKMAGDCDEILYSFEGLNNTWFGVKSLKKFEMKEERNITLTLDKAKGWYKKGGEFKEIALQAFSEKELTKVDLPKTWEEFCEDYPVQRGECFLHSRDSINQAIYSCTRGYRNWIPSKKSAEAHLALIQLEQLRNCWCGDWKPNWNDKNQSKYCIYRYQNKIEIDTFYETGCFLSFPTKEMTEEFLKCFRDLIEKAGDLI